jgi:hypothetical protein
MSQLLADRRETWITGIGLVSSLGDGLEANWDALRSGRVNIDLEKYAPWMIHPLAPLNLDSQIPKKGDQRQMEAWQRIGTYAAGLALDSAGIKDDKEIFALTDMIVAAGGGERDLDVDAAILTARADGRLGALNERLMSDLRLPCSLRSYPICSPATYRSSTACPDRHGPLWARKPPASTPSGLHGRRSPLDRARLPWSAPHTTASARKC